MGHAKEQFHELDDWEILCTFLPKDWAGQARQLGAMRRARYIKEPSTVLRVLLLHLAAGCSLAETAARASASGLTQISAVGVFKRLRAAEPWLRWMAQQLRGAAELPMEMVGRRVRAVDATSVSEPGSTGTDWRLHYAVNLADLQCDFFQLTEVHQGGETFRRFPVQAGDILMGDRIYAAPPGVAHVVKSGADVIVRLNRQAMPLFDDRGARLDLLPLLRPLRGGAIRERQSRVRSADGDWIQGRLIALRQSAPAAEAARQRLKRRAQRRQEKLSEESLEFAGYFLVWTTLGPSVPNSQILQFYRLRWQIELVFKRMKSILGLGHLPKKDPLSAQAWLEGKLFVGLLIERMIRTAESLSPWGYDLATAAQQVARS